MNRLNNKVNLIGYLGTDPELKTLEDGNSIVKCLINVDAAFKDDEGKLVKETQSFNIVAWGKSAEIMNKYCKKGSKIAIEGRLNNRSYETNGEKRYITETIVNEVLMLTPKA